MSRRGPQEWDERYRSRPWPAHPSPSVVSACADLVPGTALDLAAGTGRHARWLAGRGWSVTAVDFSQEGLAQGRALPGGDRVTWVTADVREWEPPGPVDLVLAAHVQLGVEGLRRVAGWVRPGGSLVVVGHAQRNAVDGVHGPRDPALLHSADDLRAGAAGLHVVRLEEVLRPDEGGTAIDLVLVARRAQR